MRFPWVSRAARFWAKVDKNGPTHPVLGTACWQWTAATRGKGYGAFGTGNKVTDSHRVSWELAHGLISPGLCVLHHCDNPPCVNPDHLFLGTLGDNNRDTARKGRMRNGQSSKTHCAKGHAYTPENIARFATDVGTKIRRCLTCHRARSRDFQRRRRTAA